MVLLADKASDDGSGIWASKQTMADELDCSRQAVINTIKGLIDDGLLSEVGQRQNANGFTVEYRIIVPALEALPLVKCHASRQSNVRVNLVDGSTSLTGQSGGQVNDIDPTRQPGGHKPSLNPSPPNKADALLTPAGGEPLPGDDDQEEGKGGETPKPKDPPMPAAKPKKPKGTRQTGTRLPIDWQAPVVGDLSPNVQAIVAQWPAGAYMVVAEQFANYWQAATGRYATKSDWGRTWANWLITEGPKVLRAARAGQRFDLAAKADAKADAPVDPAKAAVLEMKAGEDERMRPFRIALRDHIGRQAYGAWLKTTSMRLADGRLTIAAESAFAASHIEQHFSQAIQMTAKRLWNTDIIVRCEAPRKAMAA